MILKCNTKIIATIGPAIDSRENLRNAINAGVNIFRLNFSHGERSYFKRVIDDIRSIEKEMGISIPIIQDLQGPKIRVGNIPTPIKYAKGEKIVFCIDEKQCDGVKKIFVDYSGFPDVLTRGRRILIDDGNVELIVDDVSSPFVTATIVNDSVISSHKGINLPNSPVNLPALTEKDRSDLDFGLGCDIDYVALSFVRSHKDVIQLRDIIDSVNPDIGIISKIERPEAIDDIEKITELSDALLVARGDLGVEISLEHVPAVQRRLLKIGRRYKKPVIVATQMLESMKNSPAPTRAEVTDVYEAVAEGADVVMLSAETSVGKYPFKAVEMMRKIIEEAEKETKHEPLLPEDGSGSVEDTIALTAGALTDQLGASFTCVFTATGRAARIVSKTTPKHPILAFAMSESIRRKIGLYRGVLAYTMEPTKSIDELFEESVKKMLSMKLVLRGQRIVFVTGQPLGKAGTTNMLKVHLIE